MIVPRLALTMTLGLALASATPSGQGQDGATSGSWATGAAVALSGHVTDAATGAAVGEAQVYIEGEAVGSSSDAAGSYLIAFPDGWAGREVTVRVDRIGYAPARRTLTLGAATTTADFALTPQALGLDEIVVTGQAGKVRRREVGNSVAEATIAPTAPTDKAGAPRGGDVGIAIAPTTFSGAASAQHLRGRYNPNFHTESYALIEENEFRAVDANPLSTFSMDVDRASYSNVRRFVRQGVRPPVDAVRIEELVNYFPYGDPEPEGDAPLSITAEVATAPWQPLHQLVRIGVKARSIDFEEAPTNNLVFLIDVSGSMNTPDKLPLLKKAFRMLVQQLRPEDRVAMVVYAGAAGLVLPSTPGDEKETILSALEALEAGGSTAGGAGIRLAYHVAENHFVEGGNNRVILATDGDFNIGASSDAEMVRLIEEKRAGGTFLTVLGFGTGNLKDSKMEQLADHGNGNFAYIDSRLEARKVLVNEMGGTLVTVAQDVKIQVEFNPARVAAYRLIGYENRLLAAEDFNDDTKDAGEVGAGHTVTALYEIIPVGVESPVDIPGIDALRYQTPDGNAPRKGDDEHPHEADEREATAQNDEILFVKLRYQEPGGSPSRLLTRAVTRIVERPSRDFRFAAAVAAWGMLLRGSEHCHGYALGEVLALAEGAVGRDPHGYRAEFIDLVKQTRASELLEESSGRR